MREMQFEIVEDYGTLNINDDGYEKHLVLIRWFDKPPVFDIRTFDPNGVPKKRCGLSHDELVELRNRLNEMDL